MGYTIRIGQAVHDDDAASYGTRQLTVDEVFLCEAPSFPDDAHSQSNTRRPSYTACGEFCNATGLRDVFFSLNGEVALLAHHPGCAVLTREHSKRFHAALDAFRLIHFNAVPQFNTTDDDANLARLEWLVWWTDWALENCTLPTMMNR
jgi:hypothetical protein